MDRIARNKLKTDRFAVEVEHSVEYVAAHRKQVYQYGSIALVVALIVGGFLYYRSMQREKRQQELSAAMDIMQVNVSPNPLPNGEESYPSESAKATAAEKAFKAIYDKYSGTDEALVAASYLGALSMDAGKLADAEKYFQIVAGSSEKNYASMGKLSLAQVYLSENRTADAEKLLRELMDNPTVFVSKEQAAIALARAISVTKPAEAKKLLDPLRSERPAVSQVAIPLIAKLPQQ